MDNADLRDLWEDRSVCISLSFRPQRSWSYGAPKHQLPAFRNWVHPKASLGAVCVSSIWIWLRMAWLHSFTCSLEMLAKAKGIQSRNTIPGLRDLYSLPVCYARKSTKSISQQGLAGRLSLPPISRVILSNFPILQKPWHPHLQNGYHPTPFHRGCLEEIMLRKLLWKL